MKIRPWSKKKFWKTAAWVSAPALLFFLLDVVFPLPSKVEFTPVVLAADGTVMHTFLTRDEQWRFRISPSEITPEMRKAILAKEDKYFLYHPGINLLAVGRAVVNNVLKWKRTSGASTITMQVARMMHPRERTYVNKVVEMFRALQLEVHCSKEDIFELYLNMVPYGSNIQGVKAASVMYFGKLPAQLSLAEITALTIIPNRPNSLVPGKDNAAIISQRNEWLLRFKKEGIFPESVINDAMSEPFTAYRHNAPQVSPQLAYRLRRQYPGATEIRTTISPLAQQKATDLVTNYSNALKLNTIYNASIIVIDNATHQVKAYIGSSDFSDKAHQGEVDGVIAPRSPGSTLKPLMYGLCFDMGLITPKSVIADVPINIDGYTPENYDLHFRGNITIEDALRNSLNIPAVKMLNEAGVSNFVTKLTDAGFRSVGDKKNKVGLSLILGGCNVRLEELAGAYSALANHGTYYPLIYTSDTTGRINRGGKQIYSPEASFMIGKVLRELHRPDLPNLNDNAENIPRIAWKTGTSYGRKDAWSVGYNQHYTIAVWLGNFNGRGVAGLNGAGTATPLLFQLFSAIDRHAADEWIDSCDNIGMRLVCAETGKLPTERCTNQVMDFYLPGISHTTTCDHEKTVWVSPDEQISYCTTCLPANGYKTLSYPNIAPDLAAWYESQHVPYKKIPQHNPICTRLFEGRAPIITSLTNTKNYILLDQQSQQLQLACTAGNDVKQVYWYINDNFFASCAPGERKLFTPTTETVKISCTDDKGRNSNIVISVRFM